MGSSFYIEGHSCILPIIPSVTGTDQTLLTFTNGHIFALIFLAKPLFHPMFNSSVIFIYKRYPKPLFHLMFNSIVILHLHEVTPPPLHLVACKHFLIQYCKKRHNYFHCKLKNGVGDFTFPLKIYVQHFP